MSCLMLVDGHALAYRAYHAFPPLTTKDGELVNAVYGFSRILLTVLRDLKCDHICVSFDLPKPTFRHEKYTSYKAQREEMPTDLRTQIERIKEVVTSLNIPIYAVEGFEADDVIGTIATQAIAGKLDHEKIEKVYIVTGDRDAFQLVTDKIHVYMPPKGKDAFYLECGPQEVVDKMGITPEQIVDYKSLAGDASDNIPGVKGVGDKTAVRLLQAFGTSEKIYEGLRIPDLLTEDQKKILKPKVVENLANDYENMVMSRELATIDINVPITLELEDCVVKNYDKDKITGFFEELGFKSLIKILPSDQFEENVQAALF
jgi:DNA polymerase I